MRINGESIYETRPWIKYGEGPAADVLNPINAQGFNEGKMKYSSADIRFASKGDRTLYVTLLGVPEQDFEVKSLSRGSARRIRSVSLLGSDAPVKWVQDREALHIECPSSVPSPEAVVYKITFWK